MLDSLLLLLSHFLVLLSVLVVVGEVFMQQGCFESAEKQMYVFSDWAILQG